MRSVLATILHGHELKKHEKTIAYQKKGDNAERKRKDASSRTPEQASHRPGPRLRSQEAIESRQETHTSHATKRGRDPNQIVIADSHIDKKLKESNVKKYVTQSGKEIQETSKMMTAADWEFGRQKKE